MALRALLRGGAGLGPRGAAVRLASRPVCLTHQGRTPVVDKTALIAVTATVLGDVEVGAGSSVWYNCTLRGDVAQIKIGRRSNIQDNTVIHVSSAELGKQGPMPTIVGDDVTVGHAALLHGCTLEDRSFVGMGAIVMDGAVVSSGGMLAAGALLSAGKRVGPGELWGGRPAKLMRLLQPGEVDFITRSADSYVQFAETHKDVKLP
ncbi:trimeric LpxA-like protein [Pelagophyceae sp. CCMP2097]|nr:trimeric LpxA-like protein [Pelagophyceae sp. CCMP2097]